MTTKPNRRPILNPRYKGASPEEVAKALLRKWGPSPQGAENADKPSPDEEAEVA